MQTLLQNQLKKQQMKLIKEDVKYKKNIIKENNIVPKNVNSHKFDSLLEYKEDDKKEKVKSFKSTKEIELEIKKLEKEMKEFSLNYQFEEAIILREKIKKIKINVIGVIIENILVAYMKCSNLSKS